MLADTAATVAADVTAAATVLLLSSAFSGPTLHSRLCR